MNLMESVELALEQGATVLRLVLECIAVFSILLGLFKTLKLWVSLRRTVKPTAPFLEIRLTFGTWLALSLEFQLGADILSTTISPNQEALLNLAAIALIRTFLNYFLGKELEKEELEKEKLRAAREVEPTR